MHHSYAGVDNMDEALSLDDVADALHIGIIDHHFKGGKVVGTHPVARGITAVIGAIFRISE